MSDETRPNSAEKDAALCCNVPCWRFDCEGTQGGAENAVTLTEGERDALWEAIESAFLDTTTYSRDAEAEIERAVERIIATRVTTPDRGQPQCGHETDWPGQPCTLFGGHPGQHHPGQPQ